ncbi:MAG: NrpR regulatory domain-containing protein [Nitrospiraceae bacterium]|nr:NrpR regulatory domain-containing protein [Nitrospiraceae bacterium]
MNKTLISILRVLDKHPDIVGSREISRELKFYGINLTERTVRYHLKFLDEKGHTEVFGKEGRKITPKGREELGNAHVSDKVGFVISKIETLSYLTTLDIKTFKGDVILNISTFQEEKLKDALEILKPIFKSPYVMSDKIILAHGGEWIGDVLIPEGSVGLGTVCSVTTNGIFLKAGIPVTSKFGGVIEIIDGRPTRFISLISYEGSSLDPLEIFIRSKMTDVLGAVQDKTGRILASFREIPVVCIEQAKAMAKKMFDNGIGGILIIGEPNTPLLEVPVGIDKVGIVIVGGLNPIAAIEESGIPTTNTAMSTLYSYTKLSSFNDLRGMHEKD